MSDPTARADKIAQAGREFVHIDEYRPAPELSAEEAAKVAEFEAAPVLEEALRERVARALWLSEVSEDGDLDPVDPWGHVRTPEGRRLVESLKCDYRKLADAALAVMRGEL